MKHNSKIIIGIIGGHSHNTNDKAIQLAEKTGEILAKKNLSIACGGEDGIMEAACRGCKKFGGTTIAITKSNKKNLANKFIDFVIPTSLDLAFINVLIWSSDGIIAFDGRYGTMSEMGLALDIGKPLVALGNHNLINMTKIQSPYFAHYKNYKENIIPDAIDQLLLMINRHQEKNYKL